ncbi:glycosyltransferase, partial [Sphingomonas sp.]|uniref:glycosyltransferase n=1 Tax=Sphingomonas sp. TaxID=28214 RepID=UPI0035C79E19
SSPHYDLVGSCVLFRTPVSEVVRMVDQFGQSRLRTHLFFVDNSPTPLDLPAFDPDRVSVLRPGRNLGYGAGNNRALYASAGWSRHFLILNTDLVFDGAGLDRMVAYLDAHPDVALAAPRVVYPDGRLQTLCRLLPTPADLLGRQFRPGAAATERRNRRYEFRDWGYDHPAQFPFLSGCFMLARREALEAIGGFDERFFLYGEDVDLSRRLHARARTMFVPAMTIIHDYRSRVSMKPHLLRLMITNLARYFAKWGWLIDRDRDAVNRRTIEELDRHRNEVF